MIQCIHPLLTSIDIHNIALIERLEMVGMQEWIGYDSFNGDSRIEPWEALAGHGNVSPIYQDLDTSWGYIQTNLAGVFEELGEDLKDNTDLVTNPVNKSGFDSTCKLYFRLGTRTLTIKIESIRSHALKNG